MNPKKPKALVLFSGGLDSCLAIKILQQQGISIELVFIKLPFIKQEIPQIKDIKTKIHIINCTRGELLQDYLEIIKTPKYGYGTAMNPCKDCKMFMFKQAEKLRKKIKADFLATGEVLGQRPMSQLKHQLTLIETQTELKNKILRPLSAKLLPPTEIEEKGLVNREKLLDVNGRSRKKQIELAKEFNIELQSSGGGCLLCEGEYVKKLQDLLNHKKIKSIKPEDIQLLKIGRHFRFKGRKDKIILGKDEKENKMLENLNKSLKYNIIIPDKPGPTALFEDNSDKKFAQELIKAYSKKDISEKDKFKNQKI